MRRKILQIFSAVEGTRAMFLGKIVPAQPEALRVVCWALCEELAETPIAGVDESGGATSVVAMVAHVSGAKLVFADVSPRLVGIASPSDTDASWSHLVASAAIARAQTETHLIEKAEGLAEKVRVMTSVLPPPYVAPEEPARDSKTPRE